jgi:hypothetical protein
MILPGLSSPSCCAGPPSAAAGHQRRSYWCGWVGERVDNRRQVGRESRWMSNGDGKLCPKLTTPPAGAASLTDYHSHTCDDQPIEPRDPTRPLTDRSPLQSSQPILEDRTKLHICGNKAAKSQGQTRTAMPPWYISLCLYTPPLKHSKSQTFWPLENVKASEFKLTNDLTTSPNPSCTGL